MTAKLPAKEELIALAYHYYPRIVLTDAQAEPSLETERRKQAGRRAWQDQTRWQRLLAEVRKQSPACTVWDETIPQHAGAYWCRLCPPPYTQQGLREYHTVVGMVSYLAPIYLVYTSILRREPQSQRWQPPVLGYTPQGELEPHVKTLAHAIEAVFGYPALPLDWAFTPLADLEVNVTPYGKAQLIDALFMDSRT